MPIFQNRMLLITIFSWIIYCGFAATLIFTLVDVYTVSKAGKSAVPNPKKYGGDLLSYPKSKIIKPIVPKMFSPVGLMSSVFIFGLCAKILIKTDMAVIPTFFIAFFLSAAAELAISLLKYSYDLKFKKNLIFVPNLINMKGMVVVDIPANQRGSGEIRLACDAGVTQIKAKSMDEGILTKGTAINVVYADSDRLVVVVRCVSPDC
jgi:hypothetical protein